MKQINYLKIFTLISVVILFTGTTSLIPEEGMYPLSEIHNIDLVKAGLKINPVDVYNPNGVSLIDALVNIGGCTGSFVSNQGLILTNHHCAFGSIQQVSSTENNYLENGFLAKTLDEEIPTIGRTVKITESYEDVSEEILNYVKDIDDLTERFKMIKQKIDEISKNADDESQSIVGQVSEMFKGKTYVLFRYKIIKDVRLVYAPPRTIGEFGGETDNWIWPRHTGDFTFLRAYVAPDGSSAEYSKDNVPYTPKKYLKVNPNGVDEGDFVFILGYPGRTYRHNPSFFIEYQQNYQLPFISQNYEWAIRKYEQLSSNDPVLKLKYASIIKGLANTMKNFKGKLKGLNKINLLHQKQNEEKFLQEFINSNDSLKLKYGNLLEDFQLIYNDLFQISEANLWFSVFDRLSSTKQISKIVKEHYDKTHPHKDGESESDLNLEIEKTKDNLKRFYNILNLDFEQDFLIRMISIADKFKGKSELKTIKNITSHQSIESFVDQLLRNSKIYNNKNTEEWIDNGSVDTNDIALNFIIRLMNEQNKLKQETNRIDAIITQLSAQLYEVKKEWKKTDFIPDANSTLRLTYGYIKGYEPADAVYYSPITTLDGVIEKSLLGGEYAIPDKLRTLYEEKDFGKFFNAKLGSVPVAILYNMDTTGGNSGSPIMNAYGEMVGINFDRAYEATINDFAWNESYSRSIGVDIRYVLWITQKLGGADYLLDEMGVL